jgi:hypothetical protein
MVEIPRDARHGIDAVVKAFRRDLTEAVAKGQHRYLAVHVAAGRIGLYRDDRTKDMNVLKEELKNT